ncbi:uncharacterized protein LOC100899608 [Galendromus occidentalis]|uniref:Uncharacterized protein LOC100899608 n=1 Tax=Galendromus occidentalis TaxID=34638 RepID=A0AAJ6QT02_9ACAR|nr:uncharacterized protein LOC100899608 [Galendromus occidentalis]
MQERDGWSQQYIALSASELLFFDCQEGYLEKTPSKVIELEQVITTGDVPELTRERLSLSASDARRSVLIYYVMKGEIQLLPWMEERPRHRELLERHFEYISTREAGGNLVLLADSPQAKADWERKFRKSLDVYEFSGQPQKADEEMLRFFRWKSDFPRTQELWTY